MGRAFGLGGFWFLLERVVGLTGDFDGLVQAQFGLTLSLHRVEPRLPSFSLQIGTRFVITTLFILHLPYLLFNQVLLVNLNRQEPPNLV